MSPERYAAPLSIIETRTDDQQKCPYCRWGVHSLYRLDSWPDGYAGCASCVLKLLADNDEYFIYHSRSSTPALTNPDEHAPTSEQSQPSSTPPTEVQSASETSQARQSVGG
jgi:hypothetical protein